MEVEVPIHVETFIRSCEKDTIGKIVRLTRLLEMYGATLGMPHARHIRGPLWELRVRGREEARLFYGCTKQRIIMVHAFRKKTQKTPKREIDKAMSEFSRLTNIT
jgi:phage-related protein